MLYRRRSVTANVKRLKIYFETQRVSEIPHSVLNQYLDCTDCMGTTLVSHAFDIAFKSWPEQMWIAYRCPACDTVNHIALKSNTITQGYIDGAPAPCHVSTRIIDIPRLAVSGKRDGSHIKTLNLSWNIPASS